MQWGLTSYRYSTFEELGGPENYEEAVAAYAQPERLEKGD